MGVNNSRARKAIHRRDNAFLRPRGESIGQRGQEIAHRFRVALAEVAQNEIGERAAAFMLGADADSQAGVVLRLESGLDALEAIVAAGAAFRAKTEAPDRQLNLVDD